MQDEHHGENSSRGFNAGIGISGIKSLYAPGLGSAMSKKGGTPSGYNQSKGKSDTAWVNNQTSVVGTNSVNIDADTMRVKGGLIGNITEDGTDGKNLTINTNQFTYEDIKDYDYNQESGFGIQTTLPVNLSGSKGALDIAKDSILHPEGREWNKYCQGVKGMVKPGRYNFSSIELKYISGEVNAYERPFVAVPYLY